tara:strand:- start:753 stop:1550 length:798 start_codon:yes stop_codon:yes gene_type:complete
MRIACIQLSTGENYSKNFNQVIYFINQAIKKKADLIITPETSSIMSSDKRKLFQNSYSMQKDPLINKIREISKRNKKWILIGSLSVRDGNKLRNRSVMIGPKGNIVTYYDKIAMFNVKLRNKEIHQESKIFIPGKKLVAVKLPWGKLGLTICFDLRFPEIYRNLSKKNLNFISVPSAFTKITGQKHWLELLKARAIENFCYIFAPNQTGKNTKKRETYGHSAIISPDGKVLRLKKNGIGLIYADIKPNLSMELRKIIPTHKLSNI